MVDTVRTETELVEQLFQDGQPISSISAQDIRDLVVSVKHLGQTGWDFHLDGEFTSGAPRTILAGVRTKVTIDGALENRGHPVTAHAIPGHFWDTTTNKLVPPNINDFGFVRLAMVGQSTAASVNRFELELDVGGGSYPVIWQETGVFAKGAGNPQNFNFNMNMFAGPEFVANGGEFYITPLADATFWTFAITATRTYLADPLIV